MTFPSLPLKDGETFTPDDWFAAEAATEGGGLPRKQTLRFKPTSLTASRPHPPKITMQRPIWRAGHRRNKHGNKHGTDSPRWPSLVHTRWALTTKHTNWEDGTHTTPSQCGVFLLFFLLSTSCYSGSTLMCSSAQQMFPSSKHLL